MLVTTGALHLQNLTSSPFTTIAPKSHLLQVYGGFSMTNPQLRLMLMLRTVAEYH